MKFISGRDGEMSVVMKQISSRIIRTTIFTMCGLILLLLTTTVFRPKWYQKGGWEPVTRIHDGFYSLNKNCLDVVFIGSSHVFTGINPLLLWKKYGICSYDMTSSAQRVWISKYYVQEVLKTQAPKVIMLETGSFFFNTPNDEDRNRKALDYMKFSKEILNAIRESIYGKPEESFVSYLFPIIRFHKRWNELKEDDFRYFVSNKEFFLNGFDPRYNIELINIDELVQSSPGSGELSERNKKIIEEIIITCKKNNVSLVLFKTPSLHWSMEEHNTTSELAQKEGVDFIDYNFFVHEILLENTDFNDTYHLNANGADKLSNNIGKYLRKNYSLTQLFDSDKWENDYKLYMEYDKMKREESGLKQPDNE